MPPDKSRFCVPKLKSIPMSLSRPHVLFSHYWARHSGWPMPYCVLCMLPLLRTGATGTKGRLVLHRLLIQVHRSDFLKAGLLGDYYSCF